MGKEETMNKGSITFSPDYGVPTGSVPRGPWGPMMHEEPTQEQIARYNQNATPANTKQIGGDHYATQEIQPWDALEVWLTPDQMAGHFIASAVQYLARYNAAAPGKGGMEDVKKAHHYLSKLIELQS